MATSIPARVDPVNETMSTRGCDDSACPTSAPPCTKFTTPGGTPAASRISKNSTAEEGVYSEGFSTMVQPTARAAPTLSVI